MHRLSLLLPLLIACPGPTESPPPQPPVRTDVPPPTPGIQTCELGDDELAFSGSWSPLTYAPLVDQGTEQTYTGQLTLPLTLGLTLDDVTVFGAPATITNLVDDGTTLTADYSAVATCTGACGWTEVDVHGPGQLARLQSPTPDVSLATTALMALDISRAQAAARNGASGLLPGVRPDLDDAVPDVIAAMVATFDADGDLGVDSGGPPRTGTSVFDVVEGVLADGMLAAPSLPANEATWSLHTLDAPVGARLVAWRGHQVSLPLTPDTNNTISFHATEAAEVSTPLVFRFLFEDGTQSPAAILTRDPQAPLMPHLQIAGSAGDTITVSSATPANWVLQRSNTTGVQGACLADSSGASIFEIDPTTSFLVLELRPDLTVVDFVSCGWEQGAPICE